MKRFVNLIHLCFVLFSVIGIFSCASSHANGTTDALMIYDALRGYSVPKYRIWDGASWGPEQSASPIHGTEIYHMQIRYSPVRDEAILVALTNTGEIQAQIYNGASWSSAVTLSVVGDTLGNPNGGSLYRGFDVEYENNSGDAVIVVADNTADPNYFIWDGVSWSNGANIDIPTVGRPYWIELAHRPGSDELALITLDSNSDIYGMRWTGSVWNNMGTTAAWETSASASTKKAIDVAFENTSGSIMFAWGQSSGIKYRMYSGGSLSSPQSFSNSNGSGGINWLKLAPNSATGSDQIILAATDVGGNLNSFLWNGDMWSSPHPEHDDSLENGGIEMDFDITFETHGDNPNDAWIVWSDGDAVSRRLWDGDATSWGPATSTGDDSSVILLNAHPNNGTILASVYQDDTSTSDDIISFVSQAGNQEWSEIEQVWHGGMRRNMGIIRMSQDVQTFDNSSEAMLVYVTDDSITYPQYRRWNGTSWSDPLSTSSTNGELRHMVLKTSPRRDEAILVTLGNNGYVEAQVWNGTTLSWGNATLLGIVSDLNGSRDIQSLYRGLDVEYENNSGDAVVIFGDGTSDPSYTIWNGDSWSSPVKIDIPNTGIPNWIELAARPGSDEMAMILVDSNIDIYGMRWNGTIWDNMGAGSVWDSTGSLQTKKSIDVAYETNSGDILFIWGDSKKKYQYYREYSGITLSSTIALLSPFSNGLVSWVKLASNPLASSNQIMYGFVDDAGSLNTYLWSGTSWGSQHPEHSSTIETLASPSFDIAFESHIANPNDAWIVFGNGNTISRKLWNGPAASWGASTSQGDDTDFILLENQPTSGAFFMLGYESSTASVANMITNRLLLGTQVWPTSSIIHTGPVTRTGLPLTKIALASERYRSPSYILHQYRFYRNVNSTDVGIPLAPQNQPANLPYSGATFRLRTLLRIDVNNILTHAQDFKLQFAEKVGTCDSLYAGESYMDVTTTTPIAFQDNAPPDNASLTANLQDPIDGPRTIINQSYEELNPFTNSQTPILNGQDGKWDFALFDNGALSNTAYCFRIVRATNSAPINYSTVIPEVTMADSTGLVVDIIDADNISIPNPSSQMTPTSVSIGVQTVTSIFSLPNEKIRIKNTTANPRWTLTLAADSGPAGLWSGAGGINNYDFNDIHPQLRDSADADIFGGSMRVDPGTGSFTGTCNASGIIKGLSALFSEGVVDSTTLLTSGDNTGTQCYIDFLGITVTQKLPGEIPADSYFLPMTLTVASI